jgi:hypothetical protein
MLQNKRLHMQRYHPEDSGLGVVTPIAGLLLSEVSEEHTALMKGQTILLLLIS